MSATAITKYGVFGIRDSGAPPNNTDYTTLVMFHGFGVNSAIFQRFLPLAAKNYARVVLVNRRDYVGSSPISEEELATLRSLPSLSDDLALKALQDYMKARSKEVYDFLVDFVKSENTPVSGGIILAGWSFGNKLITGFLANVPSFSSEGVDLRKYIKRLIIYDGPSLVLGYEPPPDAYSPLFDPTLTPEELPQVFGVWVTGYYKHEEHEDGRFTLSSRDPLSNPRPTIHELSPSEVQSCFEYGPTQLPGGSDELLASLGEKYGIYSYLRDAALFISAQREENENKEDGRKSGPVNQWNDVELQFIWCDQSVWYIPLTIQETRARLEEGKILGKSLRKVTMVRINGANHFYHWTHPDAALKAILGV